MIRLERHQPPTSSGGCFDKPQRVLEEASMDDDFNCLRHNMANLCKPSGGEGNWYGVPSNNRQLANCTASTCDSKRFKHTAGRPRLVSARAPLRVCATKQPAVATSTKGDNEDTAIAF